MAEMSWPLRGAEAVGDGEVSMRELRRFYQPVYPGVYVPRVVAGLSASALLGAKWINPGRSAELIHSNRRTPPMLTVHTKPHTRRTTRQGPGVPKHAGPRRTQDSRSPCRPCRHRRA